MATLIITTVAAFVMQQFLGSETEGTRYDDIAFQGSTYDAAIPVIYAQRMATNIIWASPVRETTVEETTSSKQSSSTTITYQYLASLACAVGAGPIAAVRRIWINSIVVYDPFVTTTEAAIDATVYLGLPDEDADSEMQAYDGADNVPGYRDLAYVLIKDLDLAAYGGAMPVIEAEVWGTLTAGWGEDLAQGLCVGTDGAIWLVANLTRTVTRFDPDTYVPLAVVGRDSTAYLGSLKAQPWRIACDPGSGHLFVTCLCDGFVQRINAATGRVVADIAVGIYPHEIIAAGGFLWVSHPWLGTLSRIDPATNAVTTLPVAGQPYGLAVDGSGNLWVSCSHELLKLNPQSGAEIARVELAPVEPPPMTDAVYDTDGTMLVPAQPIDTGTSLRSQTGRWFVTGMAYNPDDGRMWFAVSGNDIIGAVHPTSFNITWRNSGTWPLYAASNGADWVYISTVFGNRIKLLRRTEKTVLVHAGATVFQSKEYQLDEFMEIKTAVWPGPMVVLSDGRCLISNMNRPFFQEIPGP